MRLTATINGGIGDLIHCHAMFEAAKDRFDDIEVIMDEHSLAAARNAQHIAFARRLLSLLFRGPLYRIGSDERGDSVGMTPQSLRQFGLAAAAPDLRDVLPIAGVEPPPPFVAVSTKVRGWSRCEYEAIRPELLRLLEAISRRVSLVLVGERVLSMVPDYVANHAGRVYSIYDDLKALPCVDATFAEFGEAPAQWEQFRSDCTTMAHAERVITLGSGGNVSMAMACGRCLAMIGGTEMGEFFEEMPAVPRLTLCKSVGEYLAELEEICSTSGS